MKEMNIRLLTDLNEKPLDLLYLADPSEDAVTDYLTRGSCYLGFINDELVGEYVLLPTRPLTVELVNLAVDERFHNKGYGKQLVQHAISVAKNSNYKVLEVGTGDAGIGQLALYQKCGFSITGIDTNFFKKHCPQAIFENGIECRHMVRLSMDL